MVWFVQREKVKSPSSLRAQCLIQYLTHRRHSILVKLRNDWLFVERSHGWKDGRKNEQIVGNPSAFSKIGIFLGIFRRQKRLIMWQTLKRIKEEEKNTRNDLCKETMGWDLISRAHFSTNCHDLFQMTQICKCICVLGERNCSKAATRLPPSFFGG